MVDHAPDVAAAFSRILDRIPKSSMDSQAGARALLVDDPVERVLPPKLLDEALLKLMEELSPSSANPLVLFMDRAGGGEGSRAAIRVMPALARRWSRFALVHVSFATQSRGLGVLLRGVLKRAGAMHKVAVHVAAHKRPAEAADLTEKEASDLLGKCTLAITYAPAGAAGLLGLDPKADQLLRRSHLSILSFPDADGLLPYYAEMERIVDKHVGVQAVRFRVQVAKGEEYEDQGTATLGKDHDAATRLGTLLNAAEKHKYRVLAQPIGPDNTIGHPILCPTESTITDHLAGAATVLRVVPIGGKLIAVARGLDTLM